MDPLETGAPDVTQQPEENAGNPAWQELFSVLPDSLHGVAKPVLDKWEQGTQAKFNEYAETTKKFEPYQQFVDSGIPADQIEQALAVAQLIDSNPQQFMEQMQAFFGEQAGSTQQQATQQQQTGNTPDYSEFGEQPFSLESDPNFQKIQQQQDIIAGFLAQEQEAKLKAEADAALESEITRLKGSYGEFDEQYVFGLALNGVDMEDAVKRYKTLEDSIRQRPAPDAGLPSIMSPGGGSPVEQVNPADMSPEQRKAYVMQALKAASES